MTTGTVVVLVSRFSRSSYFESFSTALKEVCFFVIGDRHINEQLQAGPFLLVFHYYVGPVCHDLFV